MFERLQKKWKVSGGRLLLILVTFAIGGSLTGYLGKNVMSLLGITQPFAYIPIYIIVVTLIWPKISGRMFGKKKNLSASSTEVASPEPVALNNESQKIFKGLDENKYASVRLAIFASGAGTNARAIIEHFQDHPFISVELIVCNKKGAGVIKIAEEFNIPVLMLQKDKFYSNDSYLNELTELNIDLIVLAGFLWIVPLPLIEKYQRKIINIHPALLPKFGGKGFYGHYVHEAVINAKDPESGITIHYVDEHYDNGDIIAQVSCPVLPGDTSDKLAERIHKLEHAEYPRVIEQVATQLAAL